MFPMLSLGTSIGKKHHALMKAWARVFNVIQIKILHVNIKILHVKMWQLTQQNYIITQFQKKKVRKPASTFEGLR